MSLYGTQVRLLHLKEILQNRIFEHAVEVGCGQGTLLANVAAKQKTGIDIEPIEVFSEIDYMVHDLEKDDILTHFQSDLIICSEVIEHIKDDRKLLQKLYRMTTTNGLLFLTTINSSTLVNKSEQDKERGHYRRYSLSELKMLMEQNGWRTIYCYPIRSSHYYKYKDNIKQYNHETDKYYGLIEGASGIVYVGEKE